MMNGTEQTTTLYQVKDWDTHFEGAKSKHYNNKTTCQMPTKHGLGYRRLIRQKNGPAMFGAWCAMVQVISRHPKPRQGYCADTTRIPEGTMVPYTPEDLECLTDIPARIFAEMLEICSSQAVGWLDVTTVGIPQGYHEDTTRIPQSPLTQTLTQTQTQTKTQTKTQGAKRVTSSFGEFGKVKLTEEEHAKLVEKHGEAKAAAGIDELDAWLERTGKRRGNHYACLSARSWVWEKVSDGKGGAQEPGIEAVKDYAKQYRILKTGYDNGEEISRFFKKVRDALGPNGVDQVKAMG